MRRRTRALVGSAAAIAIGACGGQSTHDGARSTDAEQAGGADSGQHGGTGNDSASGGSTGARSGELGGTGYAGDTTGTAGAGSSEGQCEDRDVAGDRRDERAYGTRGTTIGRNGTFLDFCDDDGNLVEHYCFVDHCSVDECGPNEEALEEVIACPSGCSDGTCFTWCPDEDTLVVTSIDDEIVTLEHDSGHSLACTVDWAVDGYDCAAAGLVGIALAVQRTSVCEPRFRVRIDDPTVDFGDEYECEFLCYAVL